MYVYSFVFVLVTVSGTALRVDSTTETFQVKQEVDETVSLNIYYELQFTTDVVH